MASNRRSLVSFIAGVVLCGAALTACGGNEGGCTSVGENTTSHLCLSYSDDIGTFAASCGSPTMQPGSLSCIDYGNGYCPGNECTPGTPVAVECGMSTPAQPSFSTTPCPTTGRIAHCIIHQADGTEIRVNTYQSNDTSVEDARSSCAAMPSHTQSWFFTD